MNILYKKKEINIVTLRTRLSVSDGGLQSHFRYLKKDNLVTVRKEFRGRKPHTIYSVTEKRIAEFRKLRERQFKVLK
jgi:DNA-binding PadR family transcriptional regulator